MAKQEITLQGLDGQLDELILTTNDETANGKLEDCARMLFPQEGETTPRLRFKGFEGEWEKKLLSDCLEISDEKNTDNIFGIEDVLSVSDENGVVNQIEHLGRSYAGKSVSGYKILRPGQIVYTKSPLRAKPYGIVKHNTGKAGIVSVLYAVYNTKDGVAPEYIHYYFDPAWRLNAYMRPLVNKGAKNTMNISDETALTGYIMIPKDIEEQKRIASFLQRLDDQMKLHLHQFERLKQLKSACLESMFPQQSENTPPIRFKGFEGDWVITKLNEISKKVITKNTKLEYKITLTNSAEHGIINQLDFFNHDISNGNNIRGYYVVEDDDFVYNPRISTSAPVGPINRNQLGYAGVMSPLYYVFRVEGIDKDYLNYFFKTNRWHKFMYDNGNTGARFDRLSISDDVFGQMPIVHPKDRAEQKSIASFFRGLDSNISAEQQKLDQLKQIKIACLRSMFPQNGGGILPIIRFKGFNGAWITKSFTEIFVFLKNNSLSRAELDLTGTVMNVHYGDILVKFGDLIDMNKETLPYIKNEPLSTSLVESCRLQNGDIVFADAAEDNTVGKCAEIMFVDNKNVVSGLHTIPCRPETGVFAEGFLGYCLNAPSFHDQLLPLIQGTKISSISKKALSSTFITYPSDVNEQQRIASFFRSLDTKILLQTQRIEKLKQMKAACLNKMIA